VGWGRQYVNVILYDSSDAYVADLAPLIARHL
jgi:hypothetical protein